jgi:hypothetical protein
MTGGRKGALWDDQELQHLKDMIASGVSPLRAAAALKRSITSVKAKARLLKTPFPTDREAKKLRESKYVAATQAPQARSNEMA